MNVRAGNSPPDTGGVAAPSGRRCEATAAAQTGWSGLPKCFGMPSFKEVPFSTTINASPYRARASRPSAPLKELRDFFLMSRPPLLCQEGSGAPNSFTLHPLYSKSHLHYIYIVEVGGNFEFGAFYRSGHCLPLRFRLNDLPLPFVPDANRHGECFFVRIPAI